MGNEAKKTFVQLLKYGVIGVSNTLITLVVFYVINTLMGLDYAVANTLGYILGLINSFVWNRTWVFRTGGNVWREAGLFALGFIICFALQMGVLPLPKASSAERIHENFNIDSFHISWEDMEKIKAMPLAGWSGEHPDKPKVQAVSW